MVFKGVLSDIGKIEASDGVEQELWSVGENTLYGPEIELLEAILHRSILDLGSDNKEIRSDARRFFWRDSKEPFSYCWICSVLDIRCEHFRRRLISSKLLSPDSDTSFKGKRRVSRGRSQKRFTKRTRKRGK